MIITHVKINKLTIKPDVEASRDMLASTAKLVKLSAKNLVTQR